MFVGLDQRPDFFDAAVTTDEKSHAIGSHIFPSHETLFAPNTISFNYFFILIGQKRERQFEFIDKLVMRLHRIRADTKNDRAAFFEFGKIIAKSAGFFSAARGIISWIEIKNDVFAFEICERNFSTAV